ncbi:ABC transporter substrate-binding protein [Limnobacter sp.]|uniref:ABC transporter substrate-binding protein n=1 Tax=Limnobacter sp. TaxID=2003368 RepID=UPI0039C8DD1F
MSFTQKNTRALRSALSIALISALSMYSLTSSAADKVKIGLMLPYSGTYAALGDTITNGFKQYVDENGGKLAGLPVEYYVVDDESNPSKAVENTRKLVKRDEVDVLVGTVHSGVAMAMAKVARDSKTLMIIPNAGADELTRELCAPNVFRTSFSMWQPAYAMGKVMAEKGHKKVVTLTWNYAGGKQSIEGFKESFTKGGGTIIKDMNLPFPNVEFQPFLTEIASLKPDAVFVFFAGGGAAKFLKDYEAAGLKGNIPLYGSGFLTDGVLPAVGKSADGVMTTLHYADGLKDPIDISFRANYEKRYKATPDVYAVQGYDSAKLYEAGLKAAKGDTKKIKEIAAGMKAAKFQSPRGPISISKAHNPIQNIYLREVKNGLNNVVSVAIPALDDPARGCKM